MYSEMLKILVRKTYYIIPIRLQGTLMGNAHLNVDRMRCYPEQYTILPNIGFTIYTNVNHWTGNAFLHWHQESRPDSYSAAEEGLRLNVFLFHTLRLSKQQVHVIKSHSEV